jgi:hypothetical protein
MTLAIALTFFALWLYTLILLGKSRRNFLKAMKQADEALNQRDAAIAVAKTFGRELDLWRNRTHRSNGASA